MRVTVRGVEVNLSDFKAKYLNHAYAPGAIEIKDFWADKALTPMYFESRQKYDTLRVQIMFTNAGLGDISALGELLKQCDIQIEHAFSAGKTFECILSGSAVKKESQRVHTVIYTFNCIIFGDSHDVSVTQPSDLNISQIFIPSGAGNRPGRENPMLYVSIHETDNTSVGANARGHASYLNSPDAANAPVSWHYTVDDTETVQHLPENETAFHTGDGAGNGNRQSIGIEICVNSDGDFPKAVQRAIELTADVCARRNIPVSHIMQHNHWNGKHCPRNIREGVPFGWDAFIDKVASTGIGAVNILGAKTTEAVITIENNTADIIADAGITGFIVHDLEIGEKIIIDGVKKTVTSNGQNTFNRVDFISFPRFSPGVNAIAVIGGADINIAYRERW